MINYYLNLLNIKFVRLYLICLFASIFINVIIFEFIFQLLEKRLLLIFLSAFFFFSNSVLQNFKEKTLIPTLQKKNLTLVLKLLKKKDRMEVNKWPPNKINEIVKDGNYVIDHILLLSESIIHFGIKIIINFFVIIVFKGNLFTLFFLTVIILLFNIYLLLFKGEESKFSFKLDLLHHTFHYLIHDRIDFMIDYFNKQKNIFNIKNNSNFIYINLILISIYLFINKNLDDKLYIILYARNSSYLFTLMQQIIDHHNQIIKYSSSNDILFSVNNTNEPENQIDNFKKISITNLKYLGKQFSLELVSNDKILIFGDSGIGKSTLFNIFKSLTKADELQIKINGKNYDSFLPLRNSIMLFRSDTFKYFESSVKEFVLDDLEFDEKLFNLLSEITEIKFNGIINSNEISLGQMKRISLLKALYEAVILKYSIILLDQPDSDIQEKLFYQIISKLFNSSYFENKLIMIISHNSRLLDNKLFSKILNIRENDVKLV